MSEKTRQEVVAWMYEDDYIRFLNNECSAKVYSSEHVNEHTGNKTTISLSRRQWWVPMTDEQIAHTLGWSTTEYLTQREKRDARKIEQFLRERYE